MGARDHRDLRVWQRAVDLVELVYLVSCKLPPDERFGLTSQMRRAAVSIAANVAEGNGRSHIREYLHHLSFAHGSVRELETLITIADRLRLLPSGRSNAALTLADDVGALLRALTRSLRARDIAARSAAARFPSPVSLRQGWMGGPGNPP